MTTSEKHQAGCDDGHTLITTLPARIATERLVLRPMEIGDCEAFARGANNPKVARMTATFVTPYLPQAAAFFVLRQPSLQRRGLARIWAILRGSAYVGTIAVTRQEANACWGSVWEVGYWIAEPFWGMGYASEALTAVAGKCSAPLVGRVFADNPASVRVLEKAGFVHVGRQAEPCMERQTVVEGVVLRRDPAPAGGRGRGARP